MPRLGSKAAKAKLKEIGGSLYERWSVWFNSTIRVKSYQCIEPRFKVTIYLLLRKHGLVVLHGCRQFVL